MHGVGAVLHYMHALLVPHKPVVLAVPLLKVMLHPH
jgi:hypothetical protein